MYGTDEHFKTKKEAIELWETDRDLALDLMTRVARDGDQQAMKIVAQWYYTTGDHDSALRFWKAAAEMHDIPSMMNAAQVLVEMDEMSQACEYWLQAAQQGDPQAIKSLSQHLQSVQEGTPDPDSLCYEYTKKSADMGDSRSLKLLAEWRRPVVDQQSYDLYLKAAQHGDTEGYLQCGVMKYQGTGVQRNVSAALELFIKAARMAAQPSLTDVAQVYQNGNEDFLPDYERAFQLYHEASTQDPMAYKGLGDLYFSGLGCDKDIGLAMEHYQTAVERKCMEAMVSLSICYVLVKPPRRSEAREMIKSFILKSNIEGVKAKDLTRDTLDQILDSLVDE